MLKNAKSLIRSLPDGTIRMLQLMKSELMPQQFTQQISFMLEMKMEILAKVNGTYRLLVN